MTELILIKDKKRWVQKGMVRGDFALVVYITNVFTCQYFRFIGGVNNWFLDGIMATGIRNLGGAVQFHNDHRLH